MRSNPGLMSDMEEIDLTSPMEELQSKYDNVSKKFEERDKEFIVLES